MVWDTDFGTGDEAGDNAGELEDENDVEQDFEDDNNDYVHKKVNRDKYGRSAPAQQEEAQEEEGGDDFFKVEKIEGGDEFLAVKPWTGAIREPTGWKKPPLNQNQPPKADLTLEYVHGYRAKYP